MRRVPGASVAASVLRRHERFRPDPSYNVLAPFRCASAARKIRFAGGEVALARRARARQPSCEMQPET